MVIPVTDVNMVSQLCTMLDAVLPQERAPDQLVVEAAFVYCLVWSLGAPLVETSRARFDTYLKDLSGMRTLETPGVFASPSQLPNQVQPFFGGGGDMSDFRLVLAG